jgi:hypothetical protein
VLAPLWVGRTKLGRRNHDRRLGGVLADLNELPPVSRPIS